MLQSSKSALLLLVPWLSGLVLGEVVDFSHCPSFFYKSVPPEGIDAEGYQPICQRYKNQYRFASLYHRQRRTPLYSAYTLSPGAGKRPHNIWKYEPQLVFSRASPEMHPFRKNHPISQNVIESQAVPLDYKKSNYTKGHLNPSSHHENLEDRQATFTLTNIVPQRAGSNSGPWALLEEEVRARLGAFCTGPMFVITGAMPYASGDRWIKNRVAVPEYMWSAYCCPSYNASLPESLQAYFPTYAAVGRNDRDSGEEIVPVNPKAKVSVWGFDVKQMSLETLESILRQRLAMPISLFHEKCQ